MCGLLRAFIAVCLQFLVAAPAVPFDPVPYSDGSDLAESGNSPVAFNTHGDPDQVVVLNKMYATGLADNRRNFMRFNFRKQETVSGIVMNSADRNGVTRPAVVACDALATLIHGAASNRTTAFSNLENYAHLLDHGTDKLLASWDEETNMNTINLLVTGGRALAHRPMTSSVKMDLAISSGGMSLSVDQVPIIVSFREGGTIKLSYAHDDMEYPNRSATGATSGVIGASCSR